MSIQTSNQSEYIRCECGRLAQYIREEDDSFVFVCIPCILELSTKEAKDEK